MKSFRNTNVSYGDSTQLTYLRARYYASNTGRFISRDTWGGNAEMPMSFNRWAYVNGNPINLADPTGNHPGNHSIYCNPLSGVDRLYCERIVRGISPTSNVSMVEMSVLDACAFAYNTEECFCMENISPGRMSELESFGDTPLHMSLPHSLYRGTWKEYGWWWHYLLDRTPGWWNNHGQEHVAISDVIALALGVELSILADDSKIQRYAAAAFAAKGWKEGFYYMIGSRQSVFMRINTALYGPSGAGSYNFNKYGALFNEIYTADSDYGLQANVRHLGRQILLNTGFSANERLAYEWGNPTAYSVANFPKLVAALKRAPRYDGPDTSSVLYHDNILPNGPPPQSGYYPVAFVLSQAQQNELCYGRSCVAP